MSAEPFSEKPGRCPKCNGYSAIHRYIQGVRFVDGADGCIVSLLSALEAPEERLVVKCQVCDYERLMEVASA